MAYRSQWGRGTVGVDAYRASPSLHRGADGGSGGDGRDWRAHGSRPSSSSEPYQSPEIYGLSYAQDLPGFEGNVASSTLAPAHGPAAAPEAAYLALLCHEGMADFRQTHAWDPTVAAAVETALRTMALQCTPSGRELHTRLQAMARLKDLAQSGISFCRGLDLEPYGSFVSGLYTPTGDLDLSIEGDATWQDESGRVQRVTVDSMEREMKVKFLRALASRIQAKRICHGQVERILHARVPILKFRDISGLDFDVGIGGSQALFKSTAMGLLAQYDWRFGALVRLVKLWSRHYDVNDSTSGTLNSFALTLLVVFHLQTRSPAVLPPLCQLFGEGPSSARPMQEGQFPDWRLLAVACDRLSHLSRQGGASPAGGNSETLLELAASFFALYEGLLSGGWAVPKGADAGAMRGVLRRVRVDTWGGRLRYERWAMEGYCCSVEDPFDSTDNCARTVRKEEKLGGIAEAVSQGRQLLLELEQPLQAERALEQLFGPSALHPRHLHDLMTPTGRTPAVPWVPPVDLIIPPRIQRHTEGLPSTLRISHQQARGAAGHAGLYAVQQQVAPLPLAPLPPPPGLAPAAAAAAAAEAAVAGLAPLAAVPGSHPLQQQPQHPLPPARLVSLQQLRQAMEPMVCEEAARLAELEAKAAEAAAVTAARREARRLAKKAAAKAVHKAAVEERLRARAERGRSRSRSRSSRSSGGSGTRSPALSATVDAVAVAMSNLGRSGMLATGSGSDALMAPPAAQAPGSSAAAPAAGPSAAAAGNEPSAYSRPEEVTEAAVASALTAGSIAAALAATATAVAAAGGAGSVGGSSSGGGGNGRRKERRHGKNMKAAAQARREERREGAAGVGNSTAVSVGLTPPGLTPAAATQQAAARPASAAQAAAPERQQAGPGGQARAQSRGPGRGRGQQWREAAPAAASGPVSGTLVEGGAGRPGGRGGTVVPLRVLRRQPGRGAAAAPAAAPQPSA